MNDTTKDIAWTLHPAPLVERATVQKSDTRKRWPRYISFLIVLAALSTVAGYQVARLKNSRPSWLRGTPLLTSEEQKPAALVPASHPGATDADVEAISHLAPQQQAERLLKLVIDRPDQSLGLILNQAGVQVQTATGTKVVEDVSSDASLSGLLVIFTGTVPDVFVPSIVDELVYGTVEPKLPDQARRLIERSICYESDIKPLLPKQITGNPSFPDLPLCFSPQIVPGPGAVAGDRIAVHPHPRGENPRA